MGVRSLVVGSSDFDERDSTVVARQALTGRRERPFNA
jgi:hypothetical protein